MAGRGPFGGFTASKRNALCAFLFLPQHAPVVRLNAGNPMSPFRRKNAP